MVILVASNNPKKLAELERILAEQPAGLVLSGGPSSVYDENAPKPAPGVLDLDIPILGVCYGMQYLAQQAGGDVKRAGKREYGKADLTRYGGQLFAGIQGEFVAWIMGALLLLEYGLAASVVAVGWGGYVVSLLADFGLHIPAQLTGPAGYTLMRDGVPVLVDLVDVDSAKWTEYARNRPWPMSWLYRREGERLLAYVATLDDAQIAQVEAALNGKPSAAEKVPALHGLPSTRIAIDKKAITAPAPVRRT